MWVGYLYTSTFRLLSSTLTTAQSDKTREFHIMMGGLHAANHSADVGILAQVLFTTLCRSLGNLVFNAFFSLVCLLLGRLWNPRLSP